MSDGFDAMVAHSRTFLTELEQNNDRAWFGTHKQVFKTEIEGPAKLLTTLFAQDLSRLTGTGHEGKVGRIYRDVRFSKDKSPYNTYLHCYWRGGRHPAQGWLLNIRADGVDLMTGLHGLDPDGVRQYRTAVEEKGDALVEVMEIAQANGAETMSFGDDVLKRVPKPYAPDHPHADLLKRKQIIMGRRLTEANMSDGLIAAMTAIVHDLVPFWRWCNEAMRPGA